MNTFKCEECGAIEFQAHPLQRICGDCVRKAEAEDEDEDIEENIIDDD